MCSGQYFADKRMVITIVTNCYPKTWSKVWRAGSRHVLTLAHVFMNSWPISVHLIHSRLVPLNSAYFFALKTCVALSTSTTKSSNVQWPVSRSYRIADASQSVSRRHRRSQIAVRNPRCAQPVSQSSRSANRRSQIATCFTKQSLGKICEVSHLLRNFTLGL